MEPSDWYHNVFQMSKTIWVPPLAVADVAVELLCKVRHVNPSSSHIIFIPSLMTACWRKKLSKVADVLISIPTSNAIWQESCFEPLTLAFIAPLSSTRPWVLKGLELAMGIASRVRNLSWSNPTRAGDCLREFWDTAWALDPL